MLVVRPARLSDLSAFEALASQATLGVHALPRTRTAIARALERSAASFAARVDLPGDEAYFFVLQAEGETELAGAAAIAARAGANGTFFAFRNDVIQQVSRDLGISHDVRVLTLSSDLTTHSQLSGFTLRNWHGAGTEAALLSRARLLFAALAPRRFAERFFAALPGALDARGGSPFWDALGRKFFQMDLHQAERAVEGARNRSLIVELMPHYPVYVPLLPPEAQRVMGQAHAESGLPYRVLSEEGFAPESFIDLFDAGPILQAHQSDLRAFSSALLRPALGDRQADDRLTRVGYLMCAAREDGFRALAAECPPLEEAEVALLPQAAMRALGIAAGDPVLCVRL
jgi:arginine N-succinyltransferase